MSALTIKVRICPKCGSRAIGKICYKCWKAEHPTTSLKDVR